MPADIDRWACKHRLSLTMDRPRIYGSEQKCLAAVSRYLTRTRELQDQVEGAQVRIATSTGTAAEFEDIQAEMEWEQDILRWVNQARRVMRKYLQGQLETVVPSLVSGPPRASSGLATRITLDDSIPWLLAVHREFLELHSVLGAPRRVSGTTEAPAAFVELHASRLVDESVIDDRAAEMRATRTPKQRARAIGSAQQLTEATLRGALDRLNEPYTSNDDLAVLAKKWRRAIGAGAAPDSEGTEVINNAQSALANLVIFIAQWRNAYGTGHGRPRYARDLASRHARLATDAAETYIRFVATTMDDLHHLGQ